MQTEKVWTLDEVKADWARDFFVCARRLSFVEPAAGRGASADENLAAAG
jgi:hypothetical protein